MLRAGRSIYHYRSHRPSRAALRKRIREIVKTRVCHCYRRIHVLPRREGWRVYRLYCKEGLQPRIKTPKWKFSANGKVLKTSAT